MSRNLRSCLQFSSWSTPPFPFCRLWKGQQEGPEVTLTRTAGGVTSAAASVGLTAPDNGAALRCEVANRALKAPLVANRTLRLKCES